MTALQEKFARHKARVGRKKRRVVSGQAVGDKAIKVWVCKECEVHHKDGEYTTGRPEKCINCKGDAFHHFDSAFEANHYAKLRQRERIGDIRGLQLQVKFSCHALAQSGGEVTHIGDYVADFAFYENRTAGRVVQDTKGADTALSAWKRRHVEAQYGITVETVWQAD